MANQGATLQNYNTELIKMLETIKENREEIQLEIDTEEQEKKQIEEQMRQLNMRLQEINDSLAKKYNTRQEFDKTISETENAFLKILESSQTLLHVLKKEGASLNKKKAQTLQAFDNERKSSTAKKKSDLNDFSFSQEASIASADCIQELIASPAKYSVSNCVNLFNTDPLEMQFKEAQYLVESKWLDKQNWPESSPLRIELFSLEMQAMYGSYYKNKIRVNDLVNKIILTEANRLSFVEAWKHKFRKSQKDAMQEYVAYVQKIEEFLFSIGPKAEILKSPVVAQSKNSTSQLSSSKQSNHSQQLNQEQQDPLPSTNKLIITTFTKDGSFHNTSSVRYQSNTPSNAQSNQPYAKQFSPPSKIMQIDAQEQPDCPTKFETERISKYSIEYVLSTMQNSPQKPHPRTPMVNDSKQFSILDDHLLSHSSNKKSDKSNSKVNSDSKLKQSNQQSPQRDIIVDYVDYLQENVQVQNNTELNIVNEVLEADISQNNIFNESVLTSYEHSILKFLTSNKHQTLTTPRHKKTDFQFKNFVKIENQLFKEHQHKDQDPEKRITVDLEKVPECLKLYMEKFNDDEFLDSFFFGDNLSFEKQLFTQDNCVISEVMPDNQQYEKLSQFINIKVDQLKSSYAIVKSRNQIRVNSYLRLKMLLSSPQNAILTANGSVKVIKDFNWANFYVLQRDCSKVLSKRSTILDYFTYDSQAEEGENTLLIFCKSQPTSRLSLFSKELNVGLHMIKIELLPKQDDKELVSIKQFYCVNYNMLFGSRQSQVDLAVQEQRNILKTMKEYFD